jgi:hypothetical protein
VPFTSDRRIPPTDAAAAEATPTDLLRRPFPQ